MDVIWALVFPMIVVYMILGAVAGIVVGRRFWGGAGAACLGMVLAIAPTVVAFLGFAWCFQLYR